MTLTRVFPLAPDDASPASVEGMDVASRDWLLHRYALPTGLSLRVNMIASLNGSATGDDETSNSLSSRLDRRILGVIRELSDVVLVGAGSVRVEGYLVPAKAALAVVTTSGDLTGHRLQEREGTQPVFILCPRSTLGMVEETASSAHATIVPIGDEGGDIPPASIIRALHDLGLTRIVCEGGPLLAGQLFGADLVDEFCLSTSPQVTLGGRPLLESSRTGSTRFSLRQLLLDDAGATYARWNRARPASS